MRTDSSSRLPRPRHARFAVAVLAAALLACLAAGALAYAQTQGRAAGRVVPRAFTVTGIDPASAVTGAPVTATISGAFENNGRYRVDLILGATTFSDSVAARRPDILAARFLLAGAPVGVYDVTVTDVRSAESHTLPAAFSVTSASPGPSPSPTVAKPALASISPTKGLRGARVTLKGSNFGKPRGAGYVKFGAKKCGKYISWSATKIVCKVPSGAAFGKVKVKVYTAAGASNHKYFTVKRP
jgi:hypothetical protein